MHMEKYQSRAIGRMFNHYERQEGDGVKRGNPAIDPARTHLNYNLASEIQPLSGTEFIQKRLENVKVQKRADVVKFCDCIVNPPADLPAERHREFFQHAFDFLADRYGRNNVVSAYVHMDETSPHMHFAFVPVVKNTGKSAGRFPEKLCAKDVVTRQDLQTLHPDTQRYLQEQMQCPVHLLNGATAGGAKTVAELKRQELQLVVERLQSVIDGLQKAESIAKSSTSAVEPRTYKAYKAEERGILFTHKEAVPVPGYVTIASKDLQTLVESVENGQTVQSMQDSVKTALEAVSGGNSLYAMRKQIAKLEQQVTAEHQRASKSAEMLDCWKQAVENVDSKLHHAISVLMDGEAVVPTRDDIIALYQAGRSRDFQRKR